MSKITIIDLQDTMKPDNGKFYNLLDEFKWNDIIDRVKLGEPLEKLLIEMIDGIKRDDLT